MTTQLPIVKRTKGFTLIELLVVIAVLGVLAAVVLVAINPLEQLARGRDAGRKSTVAQLSSAIQAYYTARAVNNPASPYPPSSGATWMAALVTAGEMRTVPGAIAYAGTITPCTVSPTAAIQNNYCYGTDQTHAIIWTRLESTMENQKCASGEYAWFAWSSYDGKAGVVCLAPPAQPNDVGVHYTYL